MPEEGRTGVDASGFDQFGTRVSGEQIEELGSETVLADGNQGSQNGRSGNGEGFHGDPESWYIVLRCESSDAHSITLFGNMRNGFQFFIRVSSSVESENGTWTAARSNEEGVVAFVGNGVLLALDQEIWMDGEGRLEIEGANAFSVNLSCHH